jgi:glycosyltransferase involved in cell wall biosynthesis
MKPVLHGAKYSTATPPELAVHASSQPSAGGALASSRVKGKRVAMVTFSHYPSDPRPRRAAEALVREGMSVDLVCAGEENAASRELSNGINVRRVPIRRVRGGKILYLYQYSAFIFVSALILAARSLRHRYALVYIHNMPDILVVTSLVPKVLGAKVILDLHDPMPELMQTIFQLGNNTVAVRLMKKLEACSIALADRVLTVNLACKRIFSSRSCRPEKVAIVMNTPDGEIFPFRRPQRPALRENNDCAQPFVIMYHGTIVERNGLDLAVAALARVREAIPTAELRIYGTSTPFLKRVMDEAREQGVQDAVHHLGPRRLEDLPAEIANCDVGIIPNQRNAFTSINTPTRIFEYLALGKPVIAPRTPGIQDYFDRDSLLFFESGNPEDLAHQIRYVVSHPSEAAEIVERGQQVYLAHTWLEEKRTLLNLTNELLGLA